MNNFEFITYTPTPQEKHLGIATVKLYGKIVLRYKIIKTKDGVNTFPAPATYKISDQEGDRYVPAFLIDSTTDNEALQKFIKDNMKRFLNPPNASNSVFTPSPISQRNQGDQGQAIQFSEPGRGQGTQNQPIEQNLPF